MQVISSGVQTIAAGDWHSMVLKHDGTLWATGANDYGQLGDGLAMVKSAYEKIDMSRDGACRMVWGLPRLSKIFRGPLLRTLVDDLVRILFYMSSSNPTLSSSLSAQLHTIVSFYHDRMLIVVGSGSTRKQNLTPQAIPDAETWSRTHNDIATRIPTTGELSMNTSITTQRCCGIVCKITIFPAKLCQWHSGSCMAPCVLYV